MPLLLIEVLSSNRADDLVYKSGKYAAAGAPHYWIVDPRDRTLDAYDLADGLYRPVARLADGAAASVPFGASALPVDLTALFD